jgi:hypothetical protein
VAQQRSSRDDVRAYAAGVSAQDRQNAADEVARTADPDIKAFRQKFEAVDAEHVRMARALDR